MILPDIPEELVEEIVCRIPATSLKRLRSTCKKWNRLFNDTKFSRKHFDKAAKQFQVAVMTKEHTHTFSSLSVNLHDGIPYAEVTCELSLNQVVIHEVFHYDGLLLCTIMHNNRSIVVWNSCTGQTKWIRITKIRYGQRFVLGNYQDNKTGNRSYKILSYKFYNHGNEEVNIHDINSNSWRKLDVTPPIPGYMSSKSRVSMKAKTYWFVQRDPLDFPVGLISFDYTTERFESLRLPYWCNSSGNYSLSVVGEEKLLALLQNKNSSRCEVWITNKIDEETKEMMSWSKLFEMEVGIGSEIWTERHFLVDEEKKFLVCFEMDPNTLKPGLAVFIVGANINPTRGLFPVKTKRLFWPFFMDYVPSLVQI